MIQVSNDGEKIFQTYARPAGDNQSLKIHPNSEQIAFPNNGPPNRPVSKRCPLYAANNPHDIMHIRLFFFSSSRCESPPTGLAVRETLEASVNASRTPRLCFAEHSTIRHGHRIYNPSSVPLWYASPLRGLRRMKCISLHTLRDVLLYRRLRVDHTSAPLRQALHLHAG